MLLSRELLYSFAKAHYLYKTHKSLMKNPIIHQIHLCINGHFPASFPLVFFSTSSEKGSLGIAVFMRWMLFLSCNNSVKALKEQKHWHKGKPLTAHHHQTAKRLLSKASASTLHYFDPFPLVQKCKHSS